MNVKVYDYNWIGDEASNKTNGFLAQELYSVYPDAVSKPADESTANWAVDYGRLTPLLVKSIQDLNNKISSASSTQNSADIIASLRLASLNGTVEVMGDIKIGGHIIASGDTAGRATIAAGQSRITISFAKSYIHTPIVNVTPRDFIGGLNYKVSNESANGFDIEINGAYGNDINFNWVALDVDLGPTMSTSIVPVDNTTSNNVIDIGTSTTGTTTLDIAPETESGTTTEDISSPSLPVDNGASTDASTTPAI